MLRPAVVSIAMVGLTLAGGPVLAAERWVGTSTAQASGAGTCVTLSFDLTIDGTTVGGMATSPGRRLIRWTVSGRRDGQSIKLTQNGQSQACATPRTAQLRRS